MIRAAVSAIIGVCVAVLWAGTASAAERTDARALPLSSLRSGSTFTGADAQAMQADDVANPGMLWVERGEKLWRGAAGAAGKSC